MKKTGRPIFAALLLLGLLLLSGCMSKSIESLYRPPQLPERYVQIQGAVDKILAAGADYAAPESGDNRQTAQLQDLDGDGVDEVIAFFNVVGDDKPLKIYIFKYENASYVEYAVIEGEGVSIDSIVYEDLDSDSRKDIVVGWRMSAEVKMLSVYSGVDYGKSCAEGLVYTDYTLHDMNGSGQKSVITVNLLGPEIQGDVNMYTLMDDGEIMSLNAKLTMGAESLQRVRTGTLRDGRPGVYVECTISGSGVVTDIFTLSRDQLQNVVAGSSADTEKLSTVRSYSVYSTDIDEDGVLDVPLPTPMPGQSETVYYTIDWMSFDSYGDVERKCTTYHNYSDGWYLVLPDEWTGYISVRREDRISGERTIVFSTVDESREDFRDFLEISVLTGESRTINAAESERFTLYTEDDAIYVARILGKPGEGLSVSEEMIQESFYRYTVDWTA